MTKKVDQNFWNKYFEVYDNLNLVIPYQTLLDTIVNNLEIKEDELVLEAGCGTGNLAIKIKHAGAKVIGIDNCKAALDRYKLKNPEADIIVHDLTTRLPFADNYFDKIASNDVIYSLDKEIRIEIFKEFYRTLKPGGKIVVANALKGTKPIQIYFDAVNEKKAREGLLKTIALMLKVVLPTVKMLYYNKLIVKENDNGSFDFFEEYEQFELLKNSGFKDISDSTLVYSNQSIMNSGVK